MVLTRIFVGCACAPGVKASSPLIAKVAICSSRLIEDAFMSDSPNKGG
jgi:hypothetical protein